MKMIHKDIDEESRRKSAMTIRIVNIHETEKWDEERKQQIHNERR